MLNTHTHTHTYFPSCVYLCNCIHHTDIPHVLNPSALPDSGSSSLIASSNQIPRLGPVLLSGLLFAALQAAREWEFCALLFRQPEPDDIVYLLLQTLKSRATAFIWPIIRLCYCFLQPVLKLFCGGCSLWLSCNNCFSCFYVSVCLSSSSGVFFKDTIVEIISAIILAFVDYYCNCDLNSQIFIYTLALQRTCQAQFSGNFCGSTIILTCQSYINKHVYIAM